MNVPEYRAVLEHAQRKFETTVAKAAEQLREEMHKADSAFFDEKPQDASPSRRHRESENDL